jgi:DNA-binding FadR family transcriptional regulator
MKVEKITKKSKVPEEVARAIEKIIADNDLQPGDKLPSQIELATRLNVGARSVREAIKTLEARGLIETMHGKGFYVKNKNLDYFLEVLNDSMVFNIYKDKDLLLELTYVRNMIETNVILDVARRPGKKLLQDLLEILDGMEKALEVHNISEYNRLDITFHKTIVGAKGNSIIITLYKYLSNLLEKSISKTGHMKESLEEGLQDHRLMVEALVARNPQRAGEVMEKHILSTQHKLESVLKQE